MDLYDAGGEAGLSLGPKQYLEVSYESLVTDPEKNLRMICDFLGESYEPGMLDFYRTAAEETGAVGRPDSHKKPGGRWS